MKKYYLIVWMSVLLMSQSSSAQWIKKADMNQTASGRGAAQSFALNNAVYVQGGYVGFTAGYTADMLMYDPVANSWTSKASPTEANRSAGVGFSIGAKGYVGLGAKNYLSFSPAPTLLTDMNEYDASTNTWTLKAALPDSGRTGSACFVVNNKAYVVGGKKGYSGTTTRDVWEFNPATNSWAKKGDLPVGLHHAMGFASPTHGYIVGGINENNVVTSTTYEYNPSSDTWTQKGNFVSPLVQGGIALHAGAYALCGLGSDKDLGGSGALFNTGFSKYDYANGIWSPTTYNYTGGGRLWPVGALLGNKLYVGGGYKFQSGEFAYKDWYELSPSTFTALNDMPLEHDQVWPNPASQELFLDATRPWNKLCLYDIAGRMVLQQGAEQGNKLWIGHLPAGLYILEIQGSQGNSKRRVEIQSK